jgi:type IV secretion system protein VirB6
MRFMLLSPTMLAQATPGSVDWLKQFTDNITTLTLQNGDALSQFGMLLLSFIATMMLIGIAVRMTSWSVHLGGHHRAVTLDELRNFLFRLLFCCVVEHYWVTNLPGASFGFNRMFAYVAQVIAQVLDQNSLNTLTQLINTAGQNTPMPTVLAPAEVFCYWVVEGFLGVAAGILFLLNCSAFIFYGVTALFGPLLIPLYMTETFRGKFIHFIEVLASFAMIRAVAAAFIFVWAGFLSTFINQTFAGNYSIANWIANFIPFLTVFIAFILNMVLVPTLTQIIFGGGSASAGKIGETVERAGTFGMFR